MKRFLVRFRKILKSPSFPLYTIVFGILVIVFMPFILTRSSCFKILDFSGKGEIGDTIGGITAPFIGLLSSILVYLTLKQQIDANRLINRQFRIQQLRNLEQEQFTLLLNKVREWKNDLHEVKFYHTRSMLSPGGTTEGKVAIYDIYRGILRLSTPEELESEPLHGLTIFNRVTDYLNDILVYLYAIIPYIHSEGKLKLIYLELESINRDTVNIAPNITNILKIDHSNMPVGTKEKYQMVKTYTIRNYQMLKIEKQLFEYFNPNYNYDFDPERKERYSPINRVEYYLISDSEYRSEIKTVNITPI